MDFQDIIHKEITKQEQEKLLAEMPAVVMDLNLSVEERILFIINLVKDFEKKNYGLSDEEIVYKYTRGHCYYLSSLICKYVPEAMNKGTIGMPNHLTHYFVAIKNPDFKGEYNRVTMRTNREDLILFDINGKQTHQQMTDFIFDELAEPEDKIYMGFAIGKGHSEDYNATTTVLDAKLAEGLALMSANMCNC